MWPGFDSRVEFVIGSRSCSEGFSLGSPVFLHPQKSALLNSNFDLETVDEEPLIDYLTHSQSAILLTLKHHLLHTTLPTYNPLHNVT